MRIANANLMKEINLNNVRHVMKRIETAQPNPNWPHLPS